MSSSQAVLVCWAASRERPRRGGGTATCLSTSTTTSLIGRLRSTAAGERCSPAVPRALGAILRAPCCVRAVRLTLQQVLDGTDHVGHDIVRARTRQDLVAALEEVGRELVVVLSSRA